MLFSIHHLFKSPSQWVKLCILFPLFRSGLSCLCAYKVFCWFLWAVFTPIKALFGLPKTVFFSVNCFRTHHRLIWAGFYELFSHLYGFHLGWFLWAVFAPIWVSFGLVSMSCFRITHQDMFCARSQFMRPSRLDTLVSKKQQYTTIN